MKKGLDTVLIVAAFVFTLSVLVLLAPAQQGITGAQTAQSTQSRVELTAFYAIALSNNLSNGIDFGSIDTIPSSDLDALANYNTSNNKTLYAVSVSQDSNTDVDFCIKATNMTNGGGVILPLTGYTWQDPTVPNTNNLTDPFGPGGSISMTEAFVASEANVTPGNSTYYRFWLDIPGSQEVGIYNNTVFFKGKIFGAC